MLKTINVTIRLEEDLKKQADYLFNELGLNMTTAVNAFIRQSVRQGKIPFELSLAPDYETLKLIDDVKNNRNMSRTFDSVEELMEDLNA